MSIWPVLGFRITQLKIYLTAPPGCLIGPSHVQDTKRGLAVPDPSPSSPLPTSQSQVPPNLLLKYKTKKPRCHPGPHPSLTNPSVTYFQILTFCASLCLRSQDPSPRHHHCSLEVPTGFLIVILVSTLNLHSRVIKNQKHKSNRVTFLFETLVQLPATLGIKTSLLTCLPLASFNIFSAYQTRQAFPDSEPLNSPFSGLGSLLALICWLFIIQISD